MQYLGLIHKPPNYGLVMEFAENGSLAEFLHKKDNKLDRSLKDSYIQQITAGKTVLKKLVLAGIRTRVSLVS